MLTCAVAVAMGMPFGAQAGGGDPYLKAPIHPEPGTWGYPGDSIAPIVTGRDMAQWWRHFDDTLLDSAITRALDNNYDIAQSARRLEIARAAVGKARAGYMPTVGLSAGWSKSRSSGLLEGSSGMPAYTSFFNAGATMSWEIDVFGRITQQVRMQKDNLRLTQAEYEGVRLSIAAQVASTYIDLRVAQAQMAVAIDHSESQLTAMHIAEARYEAGIASMLDVAQARTVYYTTISSIPMLQNSIHQYINSLAVLLVIPELEAYRIFETPRPLPPYLQVVEAGVPAELLARRPDIAQARADIDVQAASLGLARKDYLPSLTLQGSVGTQAHALRDMFKNHSFTYSIAPTLQWTVFDGLARKYNVRAASQQLKLAVDAYNLTVLNAFTEVDNALSTYYNNLAYIASLDKVVENSAETDALSLDKYKQGLAAYLNVANAQMSYLEAQNNLIVTKGNALQALVDLYKALGGDYLDNSYTPDKR